MQASKNGFAGTSPRQMTTRLYEEAASSRGEVRRCAPKPAKIVAPEVAHAGCTGELSRGVTSKKAWTRVSRPPMASPEASGAIRRSARSCSVSRMPAARPRPVMSRRLRISLFLTERGLISDATDLPAIKNRKMFSETPSRKEGSCKKEAWFGNKLGAVRDCDQRARHALGAAHGRTSSRVHVVCWDVLLDSSSRAGTEIRAAGPSVFYLAARALRIASKCRAQRARRLVWRSVAAPRGGFHVQENFSGAGRRHSGRVVPGCVQAYHICDW